MRYYTTGQGLVAEDAESGVAYDLSDRYDSFLALAAETDGQLDAVESSDLDGLPTVDLDTRELETPLVAAEVWAAA